MRLWDFRLLPYLPKSQLLAQKRECDLIIKDATKGKQTNHILINYIYGYGGIYSLSFKTYYALLYKEFKRRNFKFNDKYLMVNTEYAKNPLVKPFTRHHNDEYLTICYWNLREKYLRGQKDFTDNIWQELDKFYKNYMESKNVTTNII